MVAPEIAGGADPAAPPTPPGWPALGFPEAEARLTAPGSPFAVETAVIRGVPTRIWTHAPPTLRAVFEAGQRHGAATFLVYRDERASFSDFARATLALAEALRAEGVAKGDRVALAMRNLPEWPVCYYAALLVGAVATPLNAWWTGPELAFAVQDSGARVLLCDGERLARLAPHLPDCPGLERVVVSRPGGGAPAPALHTARDLAAIIGPTRAWSALPEGRMPAVALDPEDDATLFYTSGTTGQPKGALGTHRASASTVMAYPYSAARSALRRGEPLPVPAPGAAQKASLLAIPLFHVTGCHATLGSALFRGTKLVLMHRWDAETALALIEAERCTGAGGVPAIAWQLAAAAAGSERDLSSLEQVSYGGAPAAGDLVRAVGAALPRAIPATGWGMTETSATFTHHQAEEYRARPESCGPPLPVCETRIVDPDGRDLPAGAVGELWVKGPTVVRGYWRRPEATAEAFRAGWLRTGDLARRDAEGFLTIVDRLKDMLIRGGENIYCAEVEGVLFAHPAVVDAVVLPVPHPTLGEEPGALVVLAAGARATPEEIRAFAATRLAAYKVPVRVVVRAEMLPRNAGGKVLRAALRGVFAADAAAP